MSTLEHPITTSDDRPRPTGPADGITREITTAGGVFGLGVSRTYAASAADLWSAWTEPDRMARWLGRPFGDLREGGSIRLVMAGPDSVEPPPGVRARPVQNRAADESCAHHPPRPRPAQNRAADESCAPPRAHAPT